jgi:hypothetical protein
MPDTAATRWNAIKFANPTRMNQPMKNTDQQKWIWGLDDQNSIMAARTSGDPEELKRMAEDIISGQIHNWGLIFDPQIIGEELMRNAKMPFESAEKLATASRGVWDFGHYLCSRPDATAAALDFWADEWGIMVILAILKHPPEKLR